MRLKMPLVKDNHWPKDPVDTMDPDEMTLT